jgi:cell filamentation protein
MKTEREMLGRFGPNHVFSVKDINAIHRSFLGSVYEWAGSYRTVNLSKGGFPFATAIPSMMKRLEKKILLRNTPCSDSSINEIASKIAVVHVELLLIHPYREGNGRTARLLVTLMAYQAELPGIDFGFIGSRGKEFDNYITAIQQGIDENYKPMREIIRRAIQRALRRAKQ